MIHLRHRALATALLAAAATPALAQLPVATEFDALHFRSIGPATMSGRVADLAVYEKNPAVYYVATAHGGLWKTTSNGAMWTPLLQDQGLMSLGDVTMSQTNPDLVWVGGGESNNRQSTGWGDGVYKSVDGGKSFTHMGLRDTKHINRIVIDPANNDIVYVAATGPLWGPGGERGVFKTTDGGRTWRKVLAGDENTGANDLAMSSKDPRVLYASMYQRRRTNCCMNGGGPGSGIFKSVDGGETWTKLAGGLPAGDLGRIGLDSYRQDPNILYASIEAPSIVPVDSGKTGLWRSDDAGATWRKLNATNPRPMYFSQVRIDPNNADRVYMGGVGMQMTIDGGKTIETDAARVTHDDVHAIWIDPGNSEHVLIGNDGGLAVSYDMSKTWTFIPNLPVGLFYHVGYDMEMPYNICGGMQDNYNWCGPSASRHGAGIYNYDWFQILGGDGFVAIPDPRDSRWVFTESQDGNTIRRNVVTGESRSIRPNATNVTPAPAAGDPPYRFHWDTPMIHGTEAGVLFVGGNKVFRSTDRGDSWAVISPDLTRNGNRNDSTMFGVKNTDIRIARNDGIQVWPAIVALAESPKQAGQIWAGTDDGAVQMTKDVGKTWTDVTSRLPGFPAGAFIAEVVPSRFDANVAYVAVDDHRQNNYGAYVWMTTDGGTSFRRIDGGLAGEVVHTLTEDTRNANVLYVGTESGIFLSLDRGATWKRLRANFPNVRVDEITIHPRDNAMLVASHGRAIWVLDHLEPIQEYTAAQSVAAARLFSVPTALQWKAKDDRNDEFWGHQTFIGENPPTEAVISFYVKTPPQALMVRISSGTKVVRELTVPATKNRAGIQTVCWDQRVAPITGAPAGGPGGFGGGGGGGGGQFGQGGGNRTPAVPGVPVALPEAGYKPQNPCAAGGPGAGGPGGGGGFGGFGGGGNAGPWATPGTYTVSLVADGTVIDSKPMTIVMDPKVADRFAGAPRVAYDKLANDLHAAQQRGQDVATRLTALATQLTQVTAKMDSTATITPEMKTAFDAFRTEFNAVRTKFGVQFRMPGAPAAPAPGGPGGPGGGGGGGGFGGGGAAQPGNALGRVGQVKGLLLGIWEAPSAAITKGAADAMKALDDASKEAQTLLAKLPRLNETLKPSGLAITLP
ncbi:MAG: hypothetical protein IPJ78_05945 [Gemmatimonadetes bacterium]|nr:hypothetical protein [Gemmatimonadota bacterium]